MLFDYIDCILEVLVDVIVQGGLEQKQDKENLFFFFTLFQPYAFKHL